MLKLMIVDDSNIIRRKIERSADAARFDVVGMARNGAEAVAMLKRTDAEVVTMDLTMPEMDGIECVERITAIKPETRILVVSALSDVETGILALEKGARGFLCKPFSSEQLNDALGELVEGIDV
ncbi:response regulator transcription factor [Agaribacterium haliotis]|uniref:response regulator transcription factor n=1 Tax=Agaribacterium haliotis TaxID=2013869 RepID=UPI000BB552EC|nr:response regulator [Agaribacterium haliotis]